MPKTPPAEVSLEVRFWSRVDVFDVRDPKACALWRGHRLPSGYGTLTVECRGIPAPENPKTSATTALSVVHTILKGTGAIVM